MQITNPASGATVSGIVHITVSAPGVKRVSFYVDGVVKGRDASSPFTFEWYTTRYADGPHVIKAVSGDGKQSASVSVNVKNAVTPPPPPPPPAGTNPVPPPDVGCFFGAYIECVQTYTHYRPDLGPWTTNVPWSSEGWDLFEADAGKKISMLMTGGGWFWNGSFGDLQFILSQNAARGTIPVIDADTSQMGTLADIASGKLDPSIDAAAGVFAAFGKPVVLRIDAEMNGGWYAFGAEIRASSSGPAHFIAAWRRIVDRFRAAGATNVAYHWCPNVDPEGSQFPLEQIYPGESYVDWTGMTGYNHGGNPAETVDWLFGSTYDRLVALAPSKPIMLGEIGSADVSVPSSSPSKAEWIADLFGKLPVKYPAVRAFCWFNWYILENGREWDWPIESSPAALAVFKAGVASPYFV